MIKIVAKMLVRADKVEEFKAVAKELVEKSRAEAGNVFYSLNVSTTNATEHFTGILPKLGEMCEEGQPGELFTEVEY